jgi:hypothetical protein
MLREILSKNIYSSARILESGFLLDTIHTLLKNLSKTVPKSQSGDDNSPYYGANECILILQDREKIVDKFRGLFYASRINNSK